MCTRWNTPLKLGRLYPSIVRACQDAQFSFVGEGAYKPEIESDHIRVTNYGALYGTEKSRLFLQSSFFLHLGWTGLSILEAMGYGLPIITLRRSKKVKHSVEYDYLIDGFNAKILDNLEEVITWINTVNKDELEILKQGALQTYDKHSFDKFVANIIHNL